ncbi:MAG: hypothetical protein CMO81_02485, partial [Waddliaceae bacterium]|nr:hypothetical protein [Waddliaceae bacterium]
FFISPPYRLEGECKQRGNCCYYLLIEAPEEKKEMTIFARIRVWWYTELYGFYFRNISQIVDGKNIRVLSCRYLQKDGRCQHYHLRPLVCREWPRIEYFSRPGILKGCGFRAVPLKPWWRRLFRSKP